MYRVRLLAVVLAAIACSDSVGVDDPRPIPPLVFSTPIVEEGGATQSDIYLATLDGSRLKNLTQTPEVSEGIARWSPDGSLILTSDGIVIDPERGVLTNVKDLIPGLGFDSFVFTGPTLTSLSWSLSVPDNVLVTYLDTTGTDVAARVNVRTGELERFRFESAIGEFARWSPDERYIAAFCRVNRVYSVCVGDTSTRQVDVAFSISAERNLPTYEGSFGWNHLDGTLLVLVDRTVFAVSMETGVSRGIATLSAAPRCIRVLPEGQLAYPDDGALRFLDLKELSERTVFERDGIRCDFELLPSLSLIAYPARGGFELADLVTGEAIWSLAGSVPDLRPGWKSD